MQHFPEIYFWEPELSPHKMPLFQQLACDDRVGRAVYIAERPLGDNRRRLGWETTPPANYLEGPGADSVEEIIRQSHTHSVHIFSGLHWVPSIVLGQKMAIRHKRRFGIFQEPRVLEGLKGKVRLSHSWLTEGHLRAHSDFVLAVGAHGPRWFRLSGYREEIIFPFAYFLDPGESVREPGAYCISIGFVGRLEPAKGFGLFLEMIPLLPRGVTVHIAGRGSLESRIASVAASSAADVRFHGVLPISRVSGLMKDLDALILSSRTTDDGWGAVVSEALFHGVYPITSSYVGASMCLREERLGKVVEKLSSLVLANAFLDALRDGLFSASHRLYRRKWAQQHISATAGKEYLLSVFNHLYFQGGRPKSFEEHPVAAVLE